MGLDNFRDGDVEKMNSDEDVGEVQRLFPTTDLISDDEIVTGIEKFVDQKVPGYFWKAPAASTPKYHHKLATKHRGLWIHTLMVATSLEHQKWTYMNMGKISHHEMNCARAAVLLHDTLKYGDKYWDGKSADHDHDMQAANAAREIDELPEIVAECIESHMGPGDRYAGPDPRNHLEMMVHIADIFGSRNGNTPDIYKPPQELIDEHGSLPSTTDIR